MEDSIGALISDVSRLMRRYFDDKAKSIGVTRAQWLVLTLLARHEGSKQGVLAELLDVEPITLCRMVDRLQDAEMVERRRDPADRRAWLLYLTPKARVLLEELRPLAREVMTASVDGVSQKELDALRCTLGRIRNNLSR